MQAIYDQFQKNKKFMKKGAWVGFDLDGTLANDGNWISGYHIGEPIKPMFDIMKEYIDQGIEVRIMTARVSSSDKEYTEKVTKIIQSFVEKNAGIKDIPVTCRKDFGMILLYDDRCRQVIPNTGKIVE